MAVLDMEITGMLDRVRQIFGDEVLAALYGRARNAAIRQTASPAEAGAETSSEGPLRLVSGSKDAFVRALRDELDRMLTHH